jgi:hypothetical protein
MKELLTYEEIHRHTGNVGILSKLYAARMRYALKYPERFVHVKIRPKWTGANTENK